MDIRLPGFIRRRPPCLRALADWPPASSRYYGHWSPWWRGRLLADWTCHQMRRTRSCRLIEFSPWRVKTSDFLSRWDLLSPWSHDADLLAPHSVHLFSSAVSVSRRRARLDVINRLWTETKLIKQRVLANHSLKWRPLVTVILSLCLLRRSFLCR